MTEPRSLRRAVRVAAGFVLLTACLTAGPAHAATTDVHIDEVVTTGDVNDSVELYNAGATAVDVSGWIIRDEKDTSNFTIPDGTTLGARSFRAFDVHDSFGLGAADSARLFLPDGTTLVDSFSWTKHSDPSWSRCPDGTGAFTEAGAVTLGAPNDCPTVTTPTAWPGGSAVAVADAANVFGENLSGLYDEGDVLWGAQNSGKLWRLLPNGTGGWTPDTANGWTTGKSLTYPNGTGNPDDEGVTLTGAGSAGGVYVATERDNDASDTSRTSVLRYDVSGTGTTLAATQEWNLTDDLPPVDPNLGFEGITWIPDASLTAAGFVDSSTGAPYDPARYGPHTGGVFFVGVEGTGMVYGYVLQDSGAFTRVAAVSSGMPSVMELQWDPQTAQLWAVCDDNCSGQHRVLRIGASGGFDVTGIFDRPTGMPNLNNEGFALTAQCVNGSKPVYWADDDNDDGHALRAGTVTC